MSLNSISSVHRKEIINLLAKRQALAVAVSSVFCILQNDDGCKQDMKRYNAFNLQVRQLESEQLNLEHAILDLFGSWEHEERVAVLFFLLDKNNTGRIDSQILGTTLKKVAKKVSMALPEQEVELIQEALLHNFAHDDHATLNQEQFADALRYLCDHILKTSVDNCAQLFMLQIVFYEKGRDILETLVAQEGEQDGQCCAATTLEEFHQIITGVRIGLLFDMLDYNLNGRIQMSHVESHLIQFFEARNAEHGNNKDGVVDGCKAIRSMLEKRSKKHKHRMGFISFSKILVFAHSIFSKDFEFAEMANALTLSISREDFGKTEVKNFFANTNAFEEALSCSSDDEATLVSGDGLSSITVDKITSLFQLADLDKNGELDLSELVLTLRKYQAKDVALSDSIERTVALLLEGDEFRQLDQQQFETVILKLAQGSGLELDRFIDFCLVEQAFRCNLSTEESKYLESFRAKKQQRRRKPRRGSIFW